MARSRGTRVMTGPIQGVTPARPIDELGPGVRERAQTQSQGPLCVTVFLPTGTEAAHIYGVDLAKKAIQPVWVQVQNDSAEAYWLLSSGLDPDYFPASEAAHAFSATTSIERHQTLSQRFGSLQFRNPVMPGVSASGFVLTNLDEGTKAVDIDLVARSDAKSFTFVMVDPTFKATRLRVDFGSLYRDDELIEVNDESHLRRLLEELPPCVTDAKNVGKGDPLNLVLVGSQRDILGALVRRRWHATETLWSGSVWRTVRAFVQGTRYRYSPISPLHLFGRPQDGAVQKARATIHERNHARFWLSPIRFRGTEVYAGQISRDIGVKFTFKSPTISTHVIDPDVDEARRYLVEDLAYSQAVERIAFVKGAAESSIDSPRTNLVGDPYFTDGLRAVMFFGRRPSSLSNIDVLDWEMVPGGRRMRNGTPACLQELHR